jgi:hypothetical protein
MNGHGRDILWRSYSNNSCRIKSYRCADLERKNTIGHGELVESPLANPQKNGKFRDSKSLTFFLQNFNEIHGFTPYSSAQQNVVVMESGQLWSCHHFQSLCKAVALTSVHQFAESVKRI